MKKISLYIAVLPLIFSLFPAVTFAHTPDILTGGYWGGEWEDTNGKGNGLVSCGAPIVVTTSGTGDNKTTTVAPSGNACKSLCDLVHTLIHLIAFGISLTLYAAAPILFAWGGIMILISSGNPGKISEGKKILTGTLIGVLITLLAYLIVKTLLVDTLHIESYIPFGEFKCVVK